MLVCNHQINSMSEYILCSIRYITQYAKNIAQLTNLIVHSTQYTEKTYQDIL